MIVLTENRLPTTLSYFLLFLLLVSCENSLSQTVDDFGELSYIDSIENWEGWSFASHSADADPDYAQLFDVNSTTVHRIDIIIDNDDYQIMEDDMTSLYGSFGSSGMQGMLDEDPVFVPVTLKFNGQTWWYVAMRYKGNSSLRDAWQQGIHKLPFRLNFDYFDDVWQVIEGQRFWGFQKMTFSNGKNDDAMLRDALASKTFLEAGVETARTAFCRVYIDAGDGNGPVYWGLYTMIEDPSDQMLNQQFGSDSGNLYKPDDEINSTLSESNFRTDYYDKATNEEKGDWSDIKKFINTIDSTGYSDEAWQTRIESLFDVEKYLRYLAVNNTIQNWDVYGEKAHNYYLYSNPLDSDRFTWFPWDLNESFTDNRLCLSIDVYSDYSGGNFDKWPLLENILGQSEYRDDYDEYLSSYFVDSECVLSDSALISWINTYSALIKEYVIAEIDGFTWHDAGYDSGSFDGDVEDLKTQVITRIARAKSYIEE